jgi:hypothetical protein
LLAKAPLDSRLRYADHVDRYGKALFQRVCKLDVEGIVAKKNVARTSPTERAAPGSRFATGNIRRWPAVKKYLNVNGNRSQSRVGTHVS